MMEHLPAAVNKPMPDATDLELETFMFWRIARDVRELELPSDWRSKNISEALDLMDEFTKSLPLRRRCAEIRQLREQPAVLGLPCA